jgi:hypothetical protein
VFFSALRGRRRHLGWPSEHAFLAHDLRFVDFASVRLDRLSLLLLDISSDRQNRYLV